MEIKKYNKIVEKNTPKENKIKDAIISFVVGGLMGMLGHLLLNFYSNFLNVSNKIASSYMIVTLIFIGCLLTCLGFFDTLVRYTKAGLFMPITGFAHSMMSSALEFRREGFINGIGANMFKLAGSVLVYGIVSACFIALIRFLIFGGNI